MRVPSRAGWMQGVNVFERRVRGHVQNTTGSGMGLFITSEIAKIHQGWVKTEHRDGRRSFTLFLSD